MHAHRRTRVKICGVTRLDDAALAAELGADMIGLNFYPPSPRCIDVTQARLIVGSLPPGVETVAVVVDARTEQVKRIMGETGIACVQLHGSEPPSAILELAPHRVIRAFRWRDAATLQDVSTHLAECRRQGAEPVGVLLDTHFGTDPGGTGRAWNWTEASLVSVATPVLLAGGLDPDNVAHAVELLQPYAVDVASGVETEPGIKDPVRLQRFFDAVHSADRADS